MRTLRYAKRAAVVVAAGVGLMATVLLGGCGTNSDTSSSYSPMPSAPKQNASASGIAINDDLTLDQIAFESPVKRVKDRNGLEFLHFSYADKDNKVYKCRLPAAMASGKHKPAEWLALFEAYREPEAVASTKNTVTKRSSQPLGDFPFIAPKPREQKPAQQPQVEKPTPPPMPTLPPMSAASPNSRAPSLPTPMPPPGPAPASRN